MFSLVLLQCSKPLQRLSRNKWSALARAPADSEGALQPVPDATGVHSPRLRAVGRGAGGCPPEPERQGLSLGWRCAGAPEGS